MRPARLVPVLLFALLLGPSAPGRAVQPAPVPDQAAVLQSTLRKAEAGNAAAQFTVGEAYFDGAGVPKDLRVALDWYRRSASQGNRAAQYQLGRMYRYGDGTAVDAAQALHWYTLAARQGLDSAINDIGVMHHDGSAGQVDQVAARAWYGRAAAHGYGLAQWNLGRMVESGSGGPQDLHAALAWYQQAARNGQFDAAYRAGQMHLFGVGTPVDMVESARWFQLGADAGHAGSMERLGHLYLNGYGVDRDQAKAAALFARSAALGYAPAKLQLAWCLEEGAGVAKDEARAVALYTEGVAAKDSFARRQLAVMLADGRGAPADPARAAALVAAMEADRDLDGLTNLAETHRKRLQFDQADALYAAALRAGESRRQDGAGPSTMVPVLTRYASFYILTGRFAEANAMLRTAVAAEEAGHGRESAGLSGPLQMLAYVTAARDQYADAITLLERARTILKAHRLDDSDAAGSLGDIALEQDRVDDAERYFRDARRWMYGGYPIGDPAFAHNDAQVALLHVARGEYAEAERLLKQAVQVEQGQFRPDQATLAGRLAELGQVHLRQGRFDDAYRLTQQALGIIEQKVGSVRGTAVILTLLGTVEVRRRHLPQAQELLARALALDARVTGADHTDSAATLQALAELALAQGRPAQAEEGLRRALAINEAALGPGNTEVARNLDLLGQAYVAQRDFRQAQVVLARAWTIRRDADIAPQDKLATASLLAAVYRKLQRPSEAGALDAWRKEHQESTSGRPGPARINSYRMQASTGNADPAQKNRVTLPCAGLALLQSPAAPSSSVPDVLTRMM